MPQEGCNDSHSRLAHTHSIYKQGYRKAYQTSSQPKATANRQGHMSANTLPSHCPYQDLAFAALGTVVSQKTDPSQPAAGKPGRHKKQKDAGQVKQVAKGVADLASGSRTRQKSAKQAVPKEANPDQPHPLKKQKTAPAAASTVMPAVPEADKEYAHVPGMNAVAAS